MDALLYGMGHNRMRDVAGSTHIDVGMGKGHIHCRSVGTGWSPISG